MSAESADKRMPSATAAFAGAVLGIDVCIAHMIGPDILISLLLPAGTTAERVSTGNGIIGQDWWSAHPLARHFARALGACGAIAK
jgi:hypothetical protein